MSVFDNLIEVEGEDVTRTREVLGNASTSTYATRAVSSRDVATIKLMIAPQTNFSVAQLQSIFGVVSQGAMVGLAKHDAAVIKKDQLESATGKKYDVIDTYVGSLLTHARITILILEQRRNA